MRKTKVLRVRFELGLGQREIAALVRSVRVRFIIT
jgi:hypothetical protein